MADDGGSGDPEDGPFDMEEVRDRIESQLAQASHTEGAPEPEVEGPNGETYVRTGIPGLDDLFERGIPRGSPVLVAGGAGSGKTIMGL